MGGGAPEKKGHRAQCPVGISGGRVHSYGEKNLWWGRAAMYSVLRSGRRERR